MPDLTYTLTVRYPDEIDVTMLAEIEMEAEPHDDTLADKVERWCGGLIEDAEQFLDDSLPEGWRVRIDR